MRSSLEDADCDDSVPLDDNLELEVVFNEDDDGLEDDLETGPDEADLPPVPFFKLERFPEDIGPGLTEDFDSSVCCN